MLLYGKSDHSIKYISTLVSNNHFFHSLPFFPHFLIYLSFFSSRFFFLWYYTALTFFLVRQKVLSTVYILI